jgi:drug/metabolite transporter (DMT)-like permease
MPVSVPKRIVAPPVDASRSAVLQGVALALAAGFGFSLSFALIKEIGSGMPTQQVVFFRMAIGLIPLMPLLLRAPKGVLKTNRPFRHVGRIAAGLTSMTMIYWAIARMPLADAAATQFTMPLFLTILSAPLLGEIVGWRRACATLVGFGGVIIMLSPSGTGFQNLDTPYLVALGAAFFYALAAIAMRQLGATEPALRTTIYFTGVSALAAGIACLFDWQTPTPEEWMLLIGTGLIGGAAQYCLVAAYTKAPATIIAPFDYMQLIWTAALGFVIWHEVPALTAFFGALIVAAAGLYIFRRETIRRRN